MRNVLTILFIISMQSLSTSAKAEIVTLTHKEIISISKPYATRSCRRWYPRMNETITKGSVVDVKTKSGRTLSILAMPVSEVFEPRHRGKDEELCRSLTKLALENGAFLMLELQAVKDGSMLVEGSTCYRKSLQIWAPKSEEIVSSLTLKTYNQIVACPKGVLREKF